LRYSNRIEVEGIFVTLCEPYDRFVAAREPTTAMQSMFEVPDDPVSHPQACLGKDRVKHSVQRYNGSAINVVSHLPANATLWGKTTHTLSNNCCLLFKIFFQLQFLYVLFSDIVRSTSVNNSSGIVFSRFKQSPGYNTIFSDGEKLSVIFRRLSMFL